MRKLLSVIFILAMVAILVACGSSEPETVVETVIEQVEVTRIVEIEGEQVVETVIEEVEVTRIVEVAPESDEPEAELLVDTPPRRVPKCRPA